MPRDAELRKVSYTAAILLKTWFARHWENPRPTLDEIDILTRATGLSSEQVTVWFRNERWRFTCGSCPLHQRPIFHDTPGSLAAQARATSPSCMVGENGFEDAVTDAAAGAGAGGDGLPWAPQDGHLSHDLSHHNTVLVRPGSRGALRPRSFLTSDGLPIALPDYSILTSDGHVLVPASALPDGATPLGPAVFVAMDAFRGPLAPEMQWDVGIMRRRGEASNGSDVRRKEADLSGGRHSHSQRTATGRSAAGGGTAQSMMQDPWVPGTVPPTLTGACFSALPPNVSTLNPDGSVPPGAEFVVLPSAAGTLILAQVWTGGGELTCACGTC